ncbi:MAG: TrkH family potassium uptake protein [Clostridia bacterium]|nr:TrkH family potassium uptake protein [Clostridia bacterium]
MTVNYKVVLRIMGILLLVLGFSLIPSLVVALIYKEYNCVPAFLYVIIPCLVPGFIIAKNVNRSMLKMKIRDGYLVVAMSWIVASFIGALPFYFSGSIPSLVESFFESASGFTTTGSTLIPDVEALPRSILFWRSFTHWLGGMGVIVLIMALFSSLGVSGQLIASAETPGPTMDKLTPKFSDTAYNLYRIYIVFTAVETILLCLGGMSLYDSLVHSFGTAGTGGFSTYNNSIAHFSSPYLQWVIFIFMVLCGINFNLFFVLKRRGLKEMLKDNELRFYLTLIGATACLIYMDLMLTDTYTDPSACLRDSFFQVGSIITTTGFANADFDLCQTFAKMLIFLVMLTGACSSSTGGGVKIIRVLVCLKLIKRGISLKIHPNRVVPIRICEKEISQEVATGIANFVFLYVFTVFLGSLLISFNGYDLVTTITSVMTCLGNIGPGFNLVGPTCNFHFLSGFSKAVLSLLMIAGRLELFTFLMLFSPHYWNSNRV